MKKRLLPALILAAYGAFLVKIMVLRDIPIIRIGSLMLRFGGSDANGQANFIPFKTIIPYLVGKQGLIIVGINIIGNIALLVPLGFLAPLVYPNMNWKKSLALAIAVPLVIEIAQAIFHLGIFDIDDILLNGLGIMIGYGIFTAFAKIVRARAKS